MTDTDEELSEVIEAFLVADGPSQAHARLQAHPELLTARAAQRIEAIAAAQPDEARGGLVRAQGALLARCREAGIEATLADEADPTPQELAAMIGAMLNAEGWPETQEIVRSHLELLHPRALASLEATAGAADDVLARIHVLTHVALLWRCREVGLERAFSEGAQWSAASTPAGLDDFVTVATWLEARVALDPQAFPWLIETYKVILERTGAEHAEFRSAVLTQLGAALHDHEGGDPIERLSQVIAAYEAALACLPEGTTAAERSMILHNLGSAHFDLPVAGIARKESLDRAIAFYEEALRLLPPDTAPDERARTLSSLASAVAAYPTLDRGPWFERARTLYEEALVLEQELDDQEKGVMFHGLGEIWRLRLVGDTRRAIAQRFGYSSEALRYALGDGQRRPGPALPRPGEAPADLRSGAADLRQAITYYSEAKRLLDPGLDPRLFAATLHGLAAAYSALSDGRRAVHLHAAITHYEEALAWYPEEARLERAAVLSNLGGALGELPTGRRTDNLLKAITCFEEALTMLDPESEPDDYGFVCNNLGYALAVYPVGDREVTLQRAITWYERAIGVFPASSAPDEYAMIQNQLGNAYADLPRGDRSANLLRAIGCFEEAMRFRTKESDPLAYASTLNNLGGTYERLPVGDRALNGERAVRCYEEALLITTEEVSPEDYALLQNNLGVALSSLESGDLRSNLERAISCHREALRFYEPASFPWEYVSTRNNLGVAYRGLAVFGVEASQELAVENFEAAAARCDRSSSPGLFAMVQNNLGLSLSALDASRSGAFAERAIACFEAALAVYTPDAEPHDCRLAARNLAELHFGRGDFGAAAAAYGVALNAGERLYQAGQLGASKSAEVGENALAHRNAAFATARVSEAVAAFLVHERGKARVLSDALRLEVARPDRVPLAVWEAFLDAGAEVRANLASEVGSFAGSKANAETSRARLDSVRDAGAALDARIAEVRAISPGFLRERDPGALLAAIPDDHTAIVSLCATDRGGVAFVVARGIADLVRAVDLPDLTPAWLDRLLLGPEGDRESDPDPQAGWGGESPWFEAALNHALAAVSAVLLPPILAALPPETKRLVVLPSGRLFLLPLHAARLPNGAFLGDRFAVSYAPSLDVFEKVSERAGPPVERGAAVIVNPEEDPALALASAEGAVIAAHFADSVVCAGAEATRAAVGRAVFGCAYVHFACHGRYEPSSPSDSHLRLADGRLTLSDLRRGEMNLEAARVVVLSACETGVVDVARGVDEYVGLAAGFVLAGVPCVVSSLWPVPDATTALLMERFYLEHLGVGHDTVAALSESRRWLRELDAASAATRVEAWYRDMGRRGDARLLQYLRHLRHLSARDGDARPFAHPYFWSAFVVSGVGVEPKLEHLRR